MPVLARCRDNKIELVLFECGWFCLGVNLNLEI